MLPWTDSMTWGRNVRASDTGCPNAIHGHRYPGPAKEYISINYIDFPHSVKVIIHNLKKDGVAGRGGGGPKGGLKGERYSKFWQKKVIPNHSNNFYKHAQMYGSSHGKSHRPHKILMCHMKSIFTLFGY